MGDSSPFLSSCSRRQWARRRGGRGRYAVIARFGPALLATSFVLVAAAAFVAGRGGI
jgi:hypothetical protein